MVTGPRRLRGALFHPRVVRDRIDPMVYRRYFEMNIGGAPHFRELLQNDAGYTVFFGKLVDNERKDQSTEAEHALDTESETIKAMNKRASELKRAGWKEIGTKTKRAPAKRAGGGNPVKKAKSMGKARKFHGVCTLSDGRVLAVGGESGRNDVVVLKACEIYEPSAGTWESCASLPDKRFCSALMPLDNGRAMAIGGCRGDGLYLADCMIWDPEQDGWSNSPAMTEKRRKPQLVRLNEGRLLVGGGNYNKPMGLEIWDPATATWSMASEPVDCFSLMGLGERDALVIGDSIPGKCWVWRGESGDLEAIADLPLAGRRSTATVLHDGRVLVAGGKGSNSQPTDDVAIFDPETGRWRAATALPEPRFGHILHTLGSRGVLLVGGVNPDGVASTILFWDVTQDSWREVGTLKKGRRFMETSILQDGSCLVIGGSVPGSSMMGMSTNCERIITAGL